MAITSSIEQVKERTPIVDLVGQRVQLTKSGRNFKGLCPFHSEKTPSFYVFPDRDNYHCFGCGQSGDALTFVMRTESVEFGEALRILADRAGVELTTRDVKNEEDQRRTRMHDVNAAAAQYWQSLLLGTQGEAAREYLHGRGLTNQTIETFQIGWAPDSWDGLLRTLTGQLISVEELIDLGLIVERDSGGFYDRFRGRIMFPIADAQGHIVGFGGRVLGDGQPKYLNSAESPLFHKSSVLYAIDHARSSIKKEAIAIVVEGYMDAIAAHQAGISNVVAALGTALTEQHMSALKRLAPRVVLALDADAAGDAAALRSLEVIRTTFGGVATPVSDRNGLVRLRQNQLVDVRVARLPQGRDPDEVVQSRPDLFRELIAEARPIIEILIESEIARAGSDIAARGQAADNVLDFLKDLPNPIVADQFARRLAEQLGVDYGAVRNRLSDIRRATQRRASIAPSRPMASTIPSGEASIQSRDWLTVEEYLLRLLLGNSSPARVFLEHITDADFYRADARAAFLAIQATLTHNAHASLSDIVHDANGPLGEHIDWIAQWSSDVPETEEKFLHPELVTTLSQLRILNYRREIALIAAHQRERKREGDETPLPRERERINELTKTIRRIERELNRAISRPWAELIATEGHVAGAQAAPREQRNASTLSRTAPVTRIAAAG